MRKYKKISLWVMVEKKIIILIFPKKKKIIFIETKIKNKLLYGQT